MEVSDMSVTDSIIRQRGSLDMTLGEGTGRLAHIKVEH